MLPISKSGVTKLLSACLDENSCLGRKFLEYGKQTLSWSAHSEISAIFEVINWGMQVTLCVSIKPAKDGYTICGSIHVDNVCFPYIFPYMLSFCPASLTVLIPSPSSSSNCPLLPLTVCHASSLQWCPLSSFQGSCPSTAKWAPGSLSSIQS